jgi:hypothetical protein
MISDPITAALNIGKTLIERFVADPQKQAEEMRLLVELHQKGDLAELNARVVLLSGQLDINKTEASHSSIFVAGWRPFIGWVCGLALFYVAILEPMLRFIATMLGYDGEFPVIDTTLTMQVLLGMLGLVAARTREKEKNVNTNSLSKGSKQ